jgi:hypothetical protein
MNTTSLKISAWIALATNSSLVTIPVTAGVLNYGGNIYAGVSSIPPANMDLRLNATEDNTRTYVFAEQTLTLPNGVMYHAHNPGTYQSNSNLTRQMIPGGNAALVTSYIIHFDPTSGFPPKSSDGWIDFSGPIYVISQPPGAGSNDLDNTDSPLGIPFVDYASGVFAIADRGFDLGGNNDVFSITNPTAGVWRLAWSCTASTGMDELRVVEMIPEPGSVGMASLGVLALLRRLRRS